MKYVYDNWLDWENMAQIGSVCEGSILSSFTYKSLSKALIFASTNPRYDDRLFIELRVQCQKTTSSVHFVYTNWFLFWYSEQFMYTTCSELWIFMYWTGDSMDIILSYAWYCGLVGVRICAFENYFPVLKQSGTHRETDFCYSQIISRANVFNCHFYLPEVNVQVQNGRGVLYGLVPWF